MPFDYKGQRPFYLVIIADDDAMNLLAQDQRYSGVLDAPDVRWQYRFNQGTSQVDCCVLPMWKADAGRFRVKPGEELTLNKCEGDRETGKLCFTVAVDLSGLMKDESMLCNPANYTLKSIDGYTLAIQPIDQSMVTANNKSYLDGKTHLFTLTCDLKSPRDEVRIALPNGLPAWVAQCSSDNDTSTGGSFSTTTLGLNQLLGGMFAAMKGGDNLFEITIKINN